MTPLVVPHLRVMCAGFSAAVPGAFQDLLELRPRDGDQGVVVGQQAAEVVELLVGHGHEHVVVQSAFGAAAQGDGVDVDEYVADLDQSASGERLEVHGDDRDLFLLLQHCRFLLGGWFFVCNLLNGKSTVCACRSTSNPSVCQRALERNTSSTKQGNFIIKKQNGQLSIFVLLCFVDSVPVSAILICVQSGQSGRIFSYK